MPAFSAFGASKDRICGAEGPLGRCSRSVAGGRATPRPATALRSRRAVRVEATAVPPERPIFKLLSNGPEITLDDIRDAYQVCSLIPAARERSQCYSCFGLDSDRMADYYEVVLGLESALEGANNEQQQPQQEQAGWFWPALLAAAQQRPQKQAGGDNDEFRSATASMAE